MNFKYKKLNKDIFLKLYSMSESNPDLKKFFRIVTNISKIYFIAVYGVVLLYVYKFNQPQFITIVAIPLCALIASISLRKLLNTPRPYKVFTNIKTLPVKDRGSTPSNHTVSSFIIAYTTLLVSNHLFIFVFLSACLTSISRIFIGVHFPFDILSGFLLASFFAIFIFI